MANSKVYEENADVIEDVIWIAHPGACEVCTDKHGRPVSEVGIPPADSHPNCGCDQLAIPKSWGGLAEKDDGDFSISPASRRSWAEAHDVVLED